MKSSCKGKNSCAGSNVFSVTVHKQRINDSGTGLQPKLKDQIQRNLGGIIFGCLCLAQISSGGLFFIIPAWIFAGVPAFLTAWLFYWYLNHLRFCWSVVACTALSAGSTQYIYTGFFLSKVGEYRIALATIATICGGMLALVMLRGVLRITPIRRHALQAQKWLNIVNFAFAGMLFGGWMFVALLGIDFVQYISAVTMFMGIVIGVLFVVWKIGIKFIVAIIVLAVFVKGGWIAINLVSTFIGK
ncbi:hypothetical protein CUZ56_01690 [Saezia sanguinis]|uniref:Uncharacterized protein n=1 Tax=Saezia sanguinis TaxID=1965230 RepID=A0A433SDU9_9BURK|nr:hypothetical protein [Saezia sanguinis]RUS66895.1 hypothetical protein CUZ56_01690 [Saezia sanguinis]